MRSPATLNVGTNLVFRIDDTVCPDVAELWIVARTNVLFFFANVSPDFVQFQTAGANANHHPVMQFGTTAPDALAKAHDGIAVNAGNAPSGADALAFGKAGDDRNLLVAREVVHDGPNPSC